MPPLVSVFTAAHDSGDRIEVPWRSLTRQTYSNWEWVVVDDGLQPTALEHLARLGAGDRMRLHRRGRDGSIGANKAAAAALCRGEVLVELDHDDELLPAALETVAAAFADEPDTEFAYSDWIDVVDGQASAAYAPGWGLGFGAYATEVVGGKRVPVALAPAITWETVRHIVSMPNHVRAWRASAYRRLGGFDPQIAVGDDYELLVRTFLGASMARIPRPLYVQHHDRSATSASRVRNGEIQDRVAQVVADRGRELDERCLELGLVPHGAAPLTSSAPISAASRVVDPIASRAAGQGMPVLSVIVPAVGGCRALERAIDSALADPRPNVEVLVVGDACPFVDDVVASFPDSRLRHWNLESRHGDDGAAPRNYALKTMARGEAVGLTATGPAPRPLPARS